MVEIGSFFIIPTILVFSLGDAFRAGTRPQGVFSLYCIRNQYQDKEIVDTYKVVRGDLPPKSGNVLKHCSIAAISPVLMWP
jgi:hypothetical protein